MGPHYMGGGYVCVCTDAGTQWIPARDVHPALHHAQHQRQHSHDDPPADVEEQCAAPVPRLRQEQMRGRIVEKTKKALFKRTMHFYSDMTGSIPLAN